MIAPQNKYFMGMIAREKVFDEQGRVVVGLGVFLPEEAQREIKRLRVTIQSLQKKISNLTKSNAGLREEINSIQTERNNFLFLKEREEIQFWRAVVKNSESYLTALLNLFENQQVDIKSILQRLDQEKAYEVLYNLSRNGIIEITGQQMFLTDKGKVIVKKLQGLTVEER